MKLVSPIVLIGGALLVCLALLAGSAQGQTCPTISSYVVSAWELGINTTTCTKICRPGRVPGKLGYCHECSEQFVSCPTNKVWSKHTCKCECAPGYHAVAYPNRTLSDSCAPQGSSCWSLPVAGESSSEKREEFSRQQQEQDDEYYGPEVTTRQWGGGSSGGSSSGGGGSWGGSSSGSSNSCSYSVGSDSTGNNFRLVEALPGLGMPGSNLPCGLHRIYDPVDCTCKCSPFWRGGECGSCWWGEKNQGVVGTCVSQTLPSPLVGSPNLYISGCAGTTQTCYFGNSGPGPNPGCNWACKNLWTRDPETGLCTVCNPPRGTCPGFQVVDYATCTCVDGPAPPTDITSTVEEAESLLDCGPGEVNSGGTGCICPLGFTGSRCNELEEGWVPPFYVWSSTILTTPVCWDPSDPSGTLTYRPSTTAVPTWDLSSFPLDEAALNAATRWSKLASGHYDGGNGFTCGLTEEGTVHCWEFDDGVFTDLDTWWIPENVKDIAVGGNRFCFIRDDDTAMCVAMVGSSWNDHIFNYPVRSISTNGETSCVVAKVDGQVECQGGDLADDVDFATGTLGEEKYASVTVGQDYVCALVRSGANAGGLACRGTVNKNPGGSDYYVNVKAAPTGDKGRLCVTRSTMELEMYTACWAEDVDDFNWVNSAGQLTTSPTTLPEQTAGANIGASELAMGGSAWMDVSVNGVYTLYHNGSIKGGVFSDSLSWGLLPEAPAKRYADVSVTENYACALASRCGLSLGAFVMTMQDCYCPLFKDGANCDNVDCDRYWISSNIVRSYVHTDYMKYCNMSDFNEHFCTYLQYFLDTNEGIHNEMARLHAGAVMIEHPHPAQCPPAQLTWNDWAEAWEECSGGLDVTVYCDAVLLSPKDLRRKIIPFNEYRGDNYDWGVYDTQGPLGDYSPNVYDYKVREGWNMVFGNDVDQMIEALESRVGEDAPMYRCLIDRLGTTAWEPEMFASGCSALGTFKHSASLGSEARKQYSVNLLKDLYGLSSGSSGEQCGRYRLATADETHYLACGLMDDGPGLFLTTNPDDTYTVWQSSVPLNGRLETADTPLRSAVCDCALKGTWGTNASCDSGMNPNLVVPSTASPWKMATGHTMFYSYFTGGMITFSGNAEWVAQPAC